MLGLKFAYATNGADIIEIDYFNGTETSISDYPSPALLWDRYQSGAGISDGVKAAQLLTPYNQVGGKSPRYYQQIAIQRTIEAILSGRKRILLTMATGTGKTVVAFQICWKLWSSRWNRTGEYRKPRILFLADRNILVDDPKDQNLRAVWRCTPTRSSQARSCIAVKCTSRSTRPSPKTSGARDFSASTPKISSIFIIVDECHRGSARNDSSWRVILDHFKSAFQLGMTATPLREDNRDTYDYFGNPIYQYSLRQGIEDGFLAPYRVHRVITSWDAAGWRPQPNGTRSLRPRHSGR
ncbi:MAG: DEAD/DEAH box helicase family protein [Alphaproteobacteria bacterium]